MRRANPTGKSRDEHSWTAQPPSAQGTYLENNEEAEGILADKVATLKSIAIAIGDEARDQHSLLNAFDEQMAAGRGLLGTTMFNLRAMARNSSSCKLWLYIIAFAGFVFFVCYLLFRSR